MYLLDTNHCSEIITGKSLNTIKRLRELPGETQVAINTIIYGKLTLMMEKSDRRMENLVLLEAFVKLFKLYSIDKATSIQYGRIHAAVFAHFAPKDKSKRREFKIQNAGIYNHDLWITATALQHNLTIVTSDSDFDRIREVTNVRVESWRNPQTSMIQLSS